MPAAHTPGTALTLDSLPHARGVWPSIEGEWEALLRETNCRSVFMSRQWMELWFDVFGSILRPDVLRWRDADGRVVALCPVSICRERRGPFIVRRAYLNAAGEHLLASEHNMVLSLPGHESSVHADLADYVRRRADSLMLSGFVEGAVARVRAAWPPLGAEEGYESDDRYVPLGLLRSTGTPYLASLSRNTREQVRRSMRLYCELHGDPVVEVAGNPAQALAWFVELCDLHAGRWQSRGTAGAFASPGAIRFHERLIREYTRHAGALDHFAVELTRVRFGDHVVGVLYNLCYYGVANFYQSGLRYADDNRLKPGLVTHSLAIQRYLDGGDLGEYDFLAGETGGARYKESLASERRTLVWCELMTPTFRNRMIVRLRDWSRGR